ncbi:MAG: NAD(P)/FAD-dependent oxidoreductase [Clostridia bacterium]|nr:NAD(P)/FAD-dependent oxidoreductase [Clostridia bacterium]
MKKVVIIGAGIAGLTCGIYAQRSGLETEILEMHTIAGGECTGWDRGDYHFDGCIHWLMGSSPDMDLHRIWRDTGALDDNVTIVNHESFMRYEAGGRVVELYTNADRLEQHLLEISPKDKSEIKKLCKAIRALGEFGIPIDKPMDMMTAGDGLRFAVKLVGKMGMMSRYSKMKMEELAALFKEPLIGRSMLASIPGDYAATALVVTLAGMHRGDSGFPIGGSRALAKRMEQKYLSLGGKVRYRTRVEKIVVKEGRAMGVKLSDGGEVHGDYVISCADGYHTLHHLLDNNYTPEIYNKLFSDTKAYPTPTCALVFMGINAEVGGHGRGVSIQREQPVNVGGMQSDFISLLSYGYDNTMSPKGKSVIAAFYNGNFDYWHALKDDKEAYRAAKQELIDDATEALVKYYPEAEGRIEKIDVVTPETYVRYCNAWRGSWMSWGSGSKDIPRYFPGLLDGLDGFIMAGMWTLPPGGLPGAATAGRFAAHRICIKEGIAFNA